MIARVTSVVRCVYAIVSPVLVPHTVKVSSALRPAQYAKYSDGCRSVAGMGARRVTLSMRSMTISRKATLADHSYT